MTWKRVLTDITTGKLPNPVYSKDVAALYSCSKQRAFKAMQALRNWNYIRYAEISMKGVGGYLVSDAGKRLVEKWIRENVDVDAEKTKNICKNCSKADWSERSGETK